MATERPRIPKKIHVKIMAQCGGFCCICPNRGVQIHHINEDNTNNNPDNLIPICSTYHDFVTISGGNIRKMPPESLKIIRDEFYQLRRKRVLPSTLNEKEEVLIRTEEVKKE